MEDRTAKKMKLLYLMDIFSERTDDTHGITMKEIQDALASYGVSADRKTLYNDLKLLEDYGFETEGRQEGSVYRYYLLTRKLELAELKLLVDAIQAAKFISPKKSRDLVKKLGVFASRYEAEELERQVYTSSSVKNGGEAVFYAADVLHKAIRRGERVTFQYWNWNRKKERALRNGGKLYEISPWALVWDDENYYLVGYDREADKIKHYRIDKMKGVEATGLPREGREAFKAYDIKSRASSMFRMFGGDLTEVKLELTERMIPVVIDRFGRDILLIPEGDGTYHTDVRIAMSDQFLSWVIALGGEVRILSPGFVIERMKDLLEKQRGLYEA